MSTRGAKPRAILNITLAIISIYIIYQHGLVTALTFNSALFVVSNATSRLLSAIKNAANKGINIALPGGPPPKEDPNPLPAILREAVFTLLLGAHFSGLMGNWPPFSTRHFLTARDGQTSGIAEALKDAEWREGYGKLVQTLSTNFKNGYQAEWTDENGKKTRVVTLLDKGGLILAAIFPDQPASRSTWLGLGKPVQRPLTIYYADWDLDGLPDGCFVPTSQTILHLPYSRLPFKRIDVNEAFI